MASETKEERRRRRRRQVATCCRQVAAFTFSHVGLGTTVVAYSIMGGFLFRALEAPHEAELQRDVMEKRDAMIKELWEMMAPAKKMEEAGEAGGDVTMSMTTEGEARAEEEPFSEEEKREIFMQRFREYQVKVLAYNVTQRNV